MNNRKPAGFLFRMILNSVTRRDGRRKFCGSVRFGWFGSVRFGSFFIFLFVPGACAFRFFKRGGAVNGGRVFFYAGQPPQRGYILKTHNLILCHTDCSAIYPLFPRFLTCVKLYPSRW